LLSHAKQSHDTRIVFSEQSDIGLVTFGSLPPFR
jgi:hypothetical protein